MLQYPGSRAGRDGRRPQALEGGNRHPVGGDAELQHRRFVAERHGTGERQSCGRPAQHAFVDGETAGFAIECAADFHRIDGQTRFVGTAGSERKPALRHDELPGIAARFRRLDDGGEDQAVLSAADLKRIDDEKTALFVEAQQQLRAFDFEPAALVARAADLAFACADAQIGRHQLAVDPDLGAEKHRYRRARIDIETAVSGRVDEIVRNHAVRDQVERARAI